MQPSKHAPEIWFLTGSQHLYGPATLQQVADNAQAVVEGLNAALAGPARIVWRPTLKSADEVYTACLDANSAAQCCGVIAWMHTFSPAKMWIGGLQQLSKPLCHLHTQFNRDIPWPDIDMDFMNLNQSAHGGREFGHVMTRLQKPRKVIVGHWQAAEVQASLDAWIGVVMAWHALRSLKVVRFGDNMRYVAVTDGDKVEAEKVFGFSVNTHGIGDLAAAIAAQPETAVDALCECYADSYDLAPELRKGAARHAALRDAARIEAGLRAFLDDGGYQAFTDTFEDLHGLPQLPGIAVQRLMADGYGFGAEGDWKHAAWLRAIKVLQGNRPGGTSFMEDYTYHFDPGQNLCLGAHMLEICPTIAAHKPRCEIHPLGIGGKDDPVRLVFDGASGPAVNASLVDLGNRFRLIVNTLECLPIPEPMPLLPVARVLWRPQPDLPTAASAWILAGGAHHTVFSHAVSPSQLEDLAELFGIECLCIDAETRLRDFKRALQLGTVYYGLKGLA